MRLNKFIASSSALSRRAADTAVEHGRVTINGKLAVAGSQVETSDEVCLDGIKLVPPAKTVTIMLNKPTGYVCSRDGQGSATIYDLLPPEYQRLNPVGRLDKDSSGLLLLTNDGKLAEQLAHPRYEKTKVYEVTLNYALQPLTRQIITDHGVMLDDGNSQFELERMFDNDDTQWYVTMHEGRYRQIRRTFASLGFTVTALHRTQFGSYSLSGLPSGHTTLVRT